MPLNHLDSKIQSYAQYLIDFFSFLEQHHNRSYFHLFEIAQSRKTDSCRPWWNPLCVVEYVSKLHLLVVYCALHTGMQHSKSDFDPVSEWRLHFVYGEVLATSNWERSVCSTKRPSSCCSTKTIPTPCHIHCYHDDNSPRVDSITIDNETRTRISKWRGRA